MLGNQGTINLPFESSLVRFASQQFLPVWVAYALALVAPAIYALEALRRNARRAEAGLSTVPFPGLRCAAGLTAISSSSSSPCSTVTAASPTCS